MQTVIATATQDKKGSLMPSTVHIANSVIKAASKIGLYLHPKGNKESNLLRAAVFTVRIKFARRQWKVSSWLRISLWWKLLYTQQMQPRIKAVSTFRQ